VNANPSFWQRWSALLDVGVDPTPADGREATAPRLSRVVLDAAADPAAVRIHPFSLRFASPALEAAFKEQYERENMPHIRIALVVGVFLVAAFGALDASVPTPVRTTLWLIRYGILCPTGVVAIVLTFVPAVARHIEWLLGVATFLVGAGIAVMGLIAPPPSAYLYAAGLTLVIVFVFAALKLRFVVASAVGWGTIAVFTVGEVALHPVPWLMVIGNSAVLASEGLIGMTAAYFLEKLARRNFAQEKLVKRVREFGSYRLAALLGKGGMGEVWRAEHRLLARPAAIKLIRPEKLGGADAEGRHATLRRFEREAQATALLRSSHTIQLYDFGVTDDGTLYYVMELLDGFDLDTLVARFGALPWARVVHLLGQVCDSLAEAHEQRLIHRDIKPANIYACRYGRAIDFIKVLDFGLVKVHREPVGTTMTDQGEFAGTPTCMAPEQIVPDGVLDARTDIYALGCVAYWLLTGHHVFEAKTAVQMLAHHLEARPTPPSGRTGGGQPIPPRLDAIVLACLEKSPANRPQSVEALARDLASCGGGDAWTAVLARSWWSQHAVAVKEEVLPSEQRVVMPSVVSRPLEGWGR
jgi:tRNA A-37 threonylcarbamoyl transferase component Bud32